MRIKIEKQDKPIGPTKPESFEAFLAKHGAKVHMVHGRDGYRITVEIQGKSPVPSLRGGFGSTPIAALENAQANWWSGFKNGAPADEFVTKLPLGNFEFDEEN